MLLLLFSGCDQDKVTQTSGRSGNGGTPSGKTGDDAIGDSFIRISETVSRMGGTVVRSIIGYSKQKEDGGIDSDRDSLDKDGGNNTGKETNNGK
jgi:hypothetical protein